MKILSLSYYYPPHTASGSIRNYKMLTALADEGVKLSVHSGFGHGAHEVDEKRSGIKVFRRRCIYLIDWVLNARKKISGIFRSESASTAPESASINNEAFPEEQNFKPVSHGFRDFVTDFLTTPDRDIMWFFSSVFSVLKHESRKDVDLIYAIGKTLDGVNRRSVYFWLVPKTTSR